jgi:glycogen debranching enzyme
MIAFEGLFLPTGRASEGRALLRRYAGLVSDAGLLPNNEDEDNSVDAPLWFAHAVDAYVHATGDTDLGVEVLPALERVVAAYRDGTRYGIRADPTDSLITQGSAGYALTWMDARIHGVPVTPRTGKPVEVNALWINALTVLAELRGYAGLRGYARLHGHARLHGYARADPDPVRAAAAAATAAFRRRYPAGLFDVLDPADAVLRPNLLIAHRLPHGPLRGEPVPTAVDALLTPLGLRTLAPDASGYRGVHRGSPEARDRAYHQGTVWPWLLGAYVEARMAAGQPVDGLLTGLTAHLREYGLGSVSETADGDPPHAATGCPFQAWSVAELVRIRDLRI